MLVLIVLLLNDAFWIGFLKKFIVEKIIATTNENLETFACGHFTIARFRVM